MKKIRNQFADTVYDVGEKDEKLVVIVGDISHGIMQPFAKKNPGRYFNIGICEPSTVNLAAGINKVNLIPVVHTIAPFLIERSYEQIKLDFGYQSLSGNFVSVGASFDYSKLGCSHHCYSDVSLLSHLKRSRIFLPSSCQEFDALFKKTYYENYINYYRIPEFSHDVDFEYNKIIPGKSIKICNGCDLTIAVCGPLLKKVIKAKKIIEKDTNLSVEIIYYHTLKPFDNKELIKSTTKTKKLITVEDLSIHDGLFNLCLKSCFQIPNIKLKQMAVSDFITKYGSYDDLCSEAGLSVNNIVKAIHDLSRI